MSGGIKVSNRDNPIVFFDLSVGGKEIGRLKIEVNSNKYLVGNTNNDNTSRGFPAPFLNVNTN
jgi:hypothetical protein